MSAKVKVSFTLLEALLGLSVLDIQIVRANYDGRDVYFDIQGRDVPGDGIFKVQTIKSVDTKLVPDV